MTARSIFRYGDGGWAEAIGNHPALDLVNTVAWRRDPARTADLIPNGAELVRWTGFVGLLDARRSGQFRSEVTDEIAAQVRLLRERLHRVVHPLATGDEPATRDVEVLRRSLLDVLGRAEVASVMPLEWSTGLRTARDLPDELALWAWRLLEQEDVRKLRQCRAEDCGWLFLDRSKNGSRAWCSSADCGNRTRARRHYARRTAAR